MVTDSLVSDERLSEILGYGPGEIAGRRGSWGELMPPEDIRMFERRIEGLKAGVLEFFDIEHRLRTKSGDWRWVLTRGKVVARDDQGKAVRALGTILDITEHKKSQEQVRALTRALIRAQENERRNLALDLHDEIAQQISALGVLLEPVGNYLASSEPELGKQTAMISRHLQQLVEQVRTMSYELRPPGLDRLGLVSTIGQYCRDFAEQTRIKVDFCPKGMDQLKLDFETEINLFRLVQEALTNVRKHAKAGTVTIKLQALLPKIIVSIEDNGIGFDLQHELEMSFTEKKMGLRSMEERVSLLRGMMSMHSSLNHGTRISIEVPWRGITNECEERGSDC
jgi:PAS domain S-box-containing protein